MLGTMYEPPGKFGRKRRAMRRWYYLAALLFALGFAQPLLETAVSDVWEWMAVMVKTKTG